jgi:hypothetical protein
VTGDRSERKAALRPAVLLLVAFCALSVIFLIVLPVYIDPNKEVSVTRGIVGIFMGSVDARNPGASTTFAHTVLFFAPNAEAGQQDKRPSLESWLVERFGGFSSWPVPGKYSILHFRAGGPDPGILEVQPAMISSGAK